MNANEPATSCDPVDAGALLEQLRTDVRARRAAAIRDAHDPARRALQRSLDDIEITRVVSAHWPLTGRTVPEKIIALVNKVVRRYLRWYINPIVEQQNAFNDAAARALRLLAESYEELAGQVALCRAGDAESRDRPGPATGDSGRGEHAPPHTDSSTPVSRPSGYSALMELVRTRALREPEARFVELELHDALAQARLHRRVNAHWPLTGRTLLERMAALHNRIVRQYLRWLINPIVEQQNAANDALIATLEHLASIDAARRAEVAALRAHNGDV
ncbi:MAG: hypothetical protein HXY39_14045 [Chloroflexi bacterium]|nr:hypothetical protein [Chloroflexota bacterium]